MCAIRRSVTVCALTCDNILAKFFVKQWSRATSPKRGLLIAFDFFGTQGINTADVGLSSECVLAPKLYTAYNTLLDMKYLIVRCLYGHPISA